MNRAKRSFKFRLEHNEDAAFFNNIYKGLFGNRKYGLVFKRRMK